MIEMNEKEIKVNGTVPELMMDYMNLTETLYKEFSKDMGKEDAKKMIVDSVNFVMMDLKEQKKEIFRTLGEVLEALGDD